MTDSLSTSAAYVTLPSTGKNSSQTRISLDQIKSIETSGLPIHKMSEEEIAEFDRIQEESYRIPAASMKNHISQTLYGEVQVDGKTVAKLYNSGAVETSNAMGGKIARIISNDGDGPNLAQRRADEIVSALGKDATFVKSQTAATQSQWNHRPAIEWTYDYAAMKRDGYVPLSQRAAASSGSTAQTALNAQLLASSDKS